MLEDQRRLSARYVGVSVEILNHERAQVLSVAGRDVQDEIVSAGSEIHVPNLALATHLLDETADLATGVGLQADRDHRLQR